jgi:hypothetical protein
MKSRILQLMATVFAAVMLIGSSMISVSGQDNRKQPTLEGTWQTSVTPRNCSTGAPLIPAFPGILTFMQGGTMTGTSTAVTSVYGVWDRVPGAREYSFASISLRYNAAGTLLGSRKITQSVTVSEDGETFTSNGQFQDTDPAGNPTASGCSTSVGARFH